MSLIILNVDEVRRTLSASGGAFVTHDKEVDIVRFAINSGFADIVLDGQVALRVMYQRPGETEVRAQALTYYDTDGLHNYYDWQLAQSDLAKDGSLMVALCILDISGGEVSEWHTTPCAVRVLSTIHTDDSDEGDDTITPTVKERVAVLESMIQRVASGAPLVVASTSAMTDTSQIYVLSTNGNWYYHNGTTWVSGGTYGAVATDTTLTQPGVPADAKAVGDALADAFTGETLTDGESMKYVLSSKYDDFKLVDGYGYFDAKKLLNGTFDWSGAPMSGSGYDESPNYVFRYTPHTKKFLLGENTMEWICSPDFPMQEHDFNGGAAYLPEGFWVTFNPDRPTGSRFVTIPKSTFGDSGTIGNFAFNYLDGSIGLKMNEAQIVEYDPAEVLSGVTTGGLFSTTTIEGVSFYKGFLTWNWSDLFDFKNTANLYRFFNSFGFNEAYNDYAKECVYTSGTTRLFYQVKADAVGGANNATNIAQYLISKGLKFYFVSDEVAA